MSVRRYSRSPQLRGGIHYGTSSASRVIKEAVDSGVLRTEAHVLQEGERLDTVAGKRYGDGRLWWIIAAASGIGWALQVPPGTFLLIPTDLAKISSLIG